MRTSRSCSAKKWQQMSRGAMLSKPFFLTKRLIRFMCFHCDSLLTQIYARVLKKVRGQNPLTHRAVKSLSPLWPNRFCSSQRPCSLADSKGSTTHQQLQRFSSITQLLQAPGMGASSNRQNSTSVLCGGWYHRVMLGQRSSQWWREEDKEVFYSAMEVSLGEKVWERNGSLL